MECACSEGRSANLTGDTLPCGKLYQPILSTGHIFQLNITVKVQTQRSFKANLNYYEFFLNLMHLKRNILAAFNINLVCQKH